MEKEVFFMVYLHNEKTPTFKHETLKSAEIEAKRLSKMYAKKAFVLCTIKSFELIDFITHDCRPDNEFDLPF